MLVEKYGIAGLTIQIESSFDLIQQLCSKYLTNHSFVDFVVTTEIGDIEYERECSAEADRRSGVFVRHFSDAYLETLAVYRKIAERMPEYGTFLIHGSCIAVDGEGYLFCAKSGTGKSTHTRLWRELLGDHAVMVNDDKPLVHVSDSDATAYGTPWDGKHHLSSNISVPLKAVCLLERAEENSICPISTHEAYPMLLQHVYHPADKVALSQTLTLIDSLMSSVSLWHLACNMDIQAAQVSYEAMRG